MRTYRLDGEMTKKEIKEFFDIVEGKMIVADQLNIKSSGITAVTVYHPDFNNISDMVKIGEGLYNFRNVALVEYFDIRKEQDTFVIDYTEDELLGLYVEFI
ncbi:MAG: hypothetical protein Q3988_04910 [Gemella sp.]|nr:hypothetical protein [Gemella sp.]